MRDGLGEPQDLGQFATLFDRIEPSHESDLEPQSFDDAPDDVEGRLTATALVCAHHCARDTHSPGDLGLGEASLRSQIPQGGAVEHGLTISVH